MELHNSGLFRHNGGGFGSVPVNGRGVLEENPGRLEIRREERSNR